MAKRKHDKYTNNGRKHEHHCENGSELRWTEVNRKGNVYGFLLPCGSVCPLWNRMCIGFVLFIYICIAQFAVRDTTQLSRGMLGITLNVLTPPRFCTCPMPEPRLIGIYITFFMCHVNVHFVDIAGNLGVAP